jgi:hypothetical protein
MNSEDLYNDHDTGLVQLHISIHCGHSRRREEIGDREVSLGILHCPKCGFDQPLNIEIRSLSTA